MANLCKKYVIVVCVLINLAMLCLADVKPENLKPSIDVKEEQNVSKHHKTDSLTILMLLALLLLTILTIWFFKYRRFRFVHETGLSMIYGLIVGAIIRYAGPLGKKPDYAKAALINGTFYANSPPETLFLSLPNFNDTTNETIKYNLIGKVYSTEPDGLLERTVTFDPELFFNVMLPIIIFEAGYSMKRRHFFKNLGAIMSYAFIGTTISCFAVGGIMFGLTRLMSIDFSLNDCFFFGAIISATDPVTILAIFNDLNVDVDLYALVFGESVLNDAVAIVLSGSVEKYGELSAGSFDSKAFFGALGNFAAIFTGAFAMGSLMGCITALITKFTKIRDFPLLETALFFLMSYSTFQAAEAASFTGIVAVLFCGITQAHYTYNNLSLESKQRTKQLFELANFLAENFVFLYIGVSVFTFEALKWHAGFIFTAILGIIVGRFLNVYPVSFLLNLGRSNKIKFNFQHMMMFSGLRGAIAFALAIRNTSSDSRQYMVSATVIIVLSTVICCGGLTTPMLQWLQIRVGVDEELDTIQTAENTRSVSQAISTQRQYSTMGPSDQAAAPTQNQPTTETENNGTKKYEKAWLVLKWYNFDTRYMKPLLTNSRPTLMETLPQCCLPLAKLLTTEEQMSQGTTKEREDSESDTDMILDHSQLSMGDSMETNGAMPSSINSINADRKSNIPNEDMLVRLDSDDSPIFP
ncbi:sodium/hydrogen exchanger 7 isoform X4 [Patella vulgata]|uniref:sodium/hydrogen exchanger 7 isoform X4 n=1 Tax=Patella vulgata TaxID=6465 RepID=UPI0021807A48|nr:sodium/hydrogen exchanger 7 isoform X4 [Patella vulgata]XP_050398414.1 sodium/hydrogen exchanger 7 isoform X4 [Patella vulgata]